jgi:transposase
LQELEVGYSDEGHPAYHPALLLKVWLYAYALGMTSSRRLEQRIREDLAFRYLAGGARNEPRSARTFGGASNSAKARIPMKEPGWKWRARRWKSSKGSFVRFPCGGSG